MTQQFDSEILAQIVALEARQLRPLRELALATTQEDIDAAKQRVLDIENGIVELRQELE